MTVSTTSNRVIYRGNGAATNFAVPFKVLDEDHLVVRRRVFATGVIEHTYIGTDYSYSGLGDSSGTLTLSGTALADAYELIIERIVPYTQDLDIVNAGGFYPDTVEEQLDLIVMGMQQLDDLTDRALLVSEGEAGLVLPGPADRQGGKILGFDTITGALGVLDGVDFKGDPGGNVESVGLLTTIQGIAPVIPTGTDRVRTSGYSTVGVGAADYVFDAAFDLVTYSRAGFTAADGRKFRLNFEQVVNDYMFGSIDGADNADAIEAATRFAWVFPTVCLAVRSNGTSSREVAFGIGGTPATRCIIISLRLKATAVMDALVTIAKCDWATIIFAGAELWGADTTDEALALSSRLAKVGLKINDARRAQMLGSLRVFNMYYWAGSCTNAGSANFARFPFIFAKNCGSCPAAGGSSRILANWSNPVRNGVAGSYGQTTTLTVDAAPAFADPMGQQRVVKLAGYYYRIASITGTGPYTLTLSMPWIDNASYDDGAGSGTLEYVFGGGFAMRGGDSSRMHITGVDAQRCGFAVLDEALYGSDIEHLSTDTTEIWLGFGAGTVSSHIGGKVHGGYIENSNTAQILSFTNNSARIVISEIGGQGLVPTRFYKHGPRNASESLNDQRMSELYSVEGLENVYTIAALGPSFTTTYDPPSIAAGASASTTITIPSLATMNAMIAPRFSVSLGGLILFASVTAVNATTGNATATVTFFNPTAGAVNPPSGTLTVHAYRR